MRTPAGIGVGLFNHVPDPRHQMTGSKRGCRPVERAAAQNRAGAVFGRLLGWSRIVEWCPLPLKLRIRSFEYRYMAVDYETILLNCSTV